MVQKRPDLNKNFFHFFVAFIALICVAFGVLIWAGSQTPPPMVTPSENVAHQ